MLMNLLMVIEKPNQKRKGIPMLILMMKGILMRYLKRKGTHWQMEIQMDYLRKMD